MKMLGVFLVIAGLLCFNASASGELSVEDLEKIRQIVNETETRLEKRINEVEVRLEKRISTESEAQGKRITDLRNRIDFQGHLIIALIVAIITFVAVPMGVIVYQYNRQRDQRDAEIKALRQRIEELERERLIQV